MSDEVEEDGPPAGAPEGAPGDEAIGAELPDESAAPEPSELGAAGGQPLISAEESEAIIQAMRAGSLAPAALAPPSVALPEKSVALGAPDGLLRRALERSERAAQDLADIVLATLVEQVAVIADAEILASDVGPVDTVLEPYVANATAWDGVVRGSGAPWLTIIFGGAFSDVVLSRRLGAEGAAAKPGARRGGVSALGRRVLGPIARACANTVATSMLEAAPTLDLVPAGSTDAKVIGSAPCLKLGLRVRMGEVEDDVVAVLYDCALAPRPREGRAAEERMRRALTSVDVELTARLGETQLSVRELLALGVGSVVRLSGSPERPISVFAAGTQVLSGTPIVHEGNLAIEVMT